MKEARSNFCFFSMSHLCLGEVTCVFFMSLFFMHFAGVFYSKMFHIPVSSVNNWVFLGAWLYDIESYQQLFSSSFLRQIFFSHEKIIGLSFHLFVAILFSILYVFIRHRYFEKVPKIILGLLLGIVLTAFPFFLELPSMGYGIMGLHTQQPLLTVLRVFMMHGFFGIGLGVGSLFYAILPRKL